MRVTRLVTECSACFGAARETDGGPLCRRVVGPTLRTRCSCGAKSALWTFGVIVMDRDLYSWCFVAVVAAFVALETALLIYGLS